MKYRFYKPFLVNYELNQLTLSAIKFDCCIGFSKISNYFIVNFYLICTKTSTSCPEIIVAVGTCVRVTAKVRIIVTIRIGRNVNIVPPTEGWTIIIVAVCGILIILVNVIFKVSISIIVVQRVYEGVCGVLVSSRP